jgi:hypothetical protein
MFTLIIILMVIFGIINLVSKSNTSSSTSQFYRETDIFRNNVNADDDSPLPGKRVG